MSRRSWLSIGLIAAYIGAVVLANVLTTKLGLVPAGFGLVVTAGTYCAGLVLVVRNAVQEAAGRWWVIACIVAGAALSFFLGSGRIAIASGITFFIAEALDMTVYTWLRRKGWRRAVIAGTWTGAVLDTLLFLSLAGFPLTATSVGGQILVKAGYMALLALPLVKVVRGAVSRQRVLGESA